MPYGMHFVVILLVQVLDTGYSSIRFVIGYFLLVLIVITFGSVSWPGVIFFKPGEIISL